MRKTFALLATLTGLSSGEPVLWTATGSVTSTAGSFVDPSVPAGTPVTFRMTYNDRAIEDLPFTNSLGRVESDFRNDIDLSITLKIGELTWDGHVLTGLAGSPYTLVARLKSYPAPESFEPAIRGDDAGTFESFPSLVEGQAPVLALNFSGPNTFLGAGIESLEIAPSVITSATGFLQSYQVPVAGETPPNNKLQFTLDPASVAVIDLADEPFSPALTVSTPGSDFEVRWRSDPRFLYRLEKKTALAGNDWSFVEEISGTGAFVSRRLPRESTTTYYRVVTGSKPR
ncbi:MAG: hypothetical protein QNL33_12990 [Akkermansiaceae bacterium]